MIPDLQATGLYGRNDEVAAEREAASLGQASNVRNTYAQPGTGRRVQQQAQPAQAGYGYN